MGRRRPATGGVARSASGTDGQRITAGQRAISAHLRRSGRCLDSRGPHSASTWRTARSCRSGLNRACECAPNRQNLGSWPGDRQLRCASCPLQWAKVGVRVQRGGGSGHRPRSARSQNPSLLRALQPLTTGRLRWSASARSSLRVARSRLRGRRQPSLRGVRGRPSAGCVLIGGSQAPRGVLTSFGRPWPRRR